MKKTDKKFIINKIPYYSKMINIIGGGLVILYSIRCAYLKYMYGPLSTDKVGKRENIITTIDTTQDFDEIEDLCHNLVDEMKINNFEIYYSAEVSFEASTYVIYNKNVVVLPALILLKESTLRKMVNIENIDDIILSEEEKKFIIAHELSHLQFNHYHIDLVYSFVWGILQGLAITINRMDIWTSIILIGLLGLVGIHRYGEKQADLNACKIIGNNIGGIKFMERAKLLQIKNGSDNFMKYFVSKNGDNYGDIMHPLLSSRIEYMKKIM